MNFFNLFRTTGKTPATPQRSTNRFEPYSTRSKPRQDAFSELDPSPSKTSSQGKRRTAPLTREYAMYIDPTPITPITPTTPLAPTLILDDNESSDRMDSEALQNPCDQSWPLRSCHWGDGYDSPSESMYESADEDEFGPYTPPSSWSIHMYKREEVLDHLYATRTAAELRAADLERKLEDTAKKLDDQRAELDKTKNAADAARAESEEQEKRLNRTMETYNRKIQTLLAQHHKEHQESEESRRQETMDAEDEFTKKLDEEKRRAQEALDQLSQWKIKAEAAIRTREALRVEAEVYARQQEQVRIAAEAEILLLRAELEHLRNSRPVDEQSRVRDQFQIYEQKWQVLRAGTGVADNSVPFSDMPWPLLTSLDDLEKLTLDSVRTFVFHDSRPDTIVQKNYRDKLKVELLRFHPDKFAIALRKVLSEDKDRCLAAAIRVAQIVNDLMTSPQ